MLRLLIGMTELVCSHIFDQRDMNAALGLLMIDPASAAQIAAIDRSLCAVVAAYVPKGVKVLIREALI